jgi:hypothetical protein
MCVTCENTVKEGAGDRTGPKSAESFGVVGGTAPERSIYGRHTPLSAVPAATEAIIDAAGSRTG